MASTTSSKKKYDVFLSFRGEDTRQGFTSHVYKALTDAGIETFMDDNLPRGEEISQTLLKRIEESEISVVIISENYASSQWCLDELVKIMDCKKTMKQKIFLIFYGVNPSDVRNQTGNFGKGFGKVKERFKDNKNKIQRWSSALREAANISGLDSKSRNYRNEPELIAHVVRNILDRPNQVSLSGSNSLIGIDSRIEQIQTLLCTNSTDVRWIGIWGMGGIGKTTYIEVLYENIKNQFDGYYFVRNVGENSEKGNLVTLKKNMFSVILKDSNLNLQTLYVLDDSIKRRLHRKKVLIVLDDVSDPLQIETLVGERDWYGPGSRIIITSRQKLMHFDETYEVKGLIANEALELFSWKAFRQNQPPRGYVKQSEWVVEHVCGNPLALKVLGSRLYRRSKEVWDGVLETLEGNNYINGIHDVLKISFEGLEKEEKNIFLDIACFFKGEDKYWVETILDHYGSPAIIKLIISCLEDKSLITISNNRLQMHDLLQEMGRNIVIEESKSPGKCSRLWIASDIIDVLQNNQGTDAIQGIFLDISTIGKVKVNLSPVAFSNMLNLRLLIFYDSTKRYETRTVKFTRQGDNDASFVSADAISNGLQSLPNKLRYLHWHGYPWKILPSKFSMENLVELSMPFSRIEQLWNGDQNPRKLKKLNLYFSNQLTGLSDLSLAPNLESIILDKCMGLQVIPSSIQCLHQLTHLSLMSCRQLTSLPSLIQFKSLKTLNLHDCWNLDMFPEIPENIEDLYLEKTSLRYWPPHISVPSKIRCLGLGGFYNLKCLNLSGLNCLEYLSVGDWSEPQKPPPLFGFPYLTQLFLINSGMLQLPPLYGLPSLKKLHIVNCTLLELPPLYGLFSLTELSLDNCGLLELWSDIGCLSSLKRLFIERNHFEILPASIKQLSLLEHLFLIDCEKLKCLPELPGRIKNLMVRNCISLETVASSSIIHPEGIEYDFVFVGCINLDSNNITEYALRRIQSLGPPPENYKTVHGFYPANKISKWFIYRGRGKTICTKLPRHWNNPKFMGFAFCATLELDDYFKQYRNEICVECFCCFKENGSDKEHHYISTNGFSRILSPLKSDHMYFWYTPLIFECDLGKEPIRTHAGYCCFRRYSFQELVQFDFFAFYDNWNSRVRTAHQLKVKSCGVRPIWNEWQCNPTNSIMGPSSSSS